MRHYPHPILAREGWLFIAISVIISLTILINANFWIALPFILISVFIIQFFRDPPRTIPQDANIILSPADGKIICVEHIEDPYQKTPSIKISVFMNVFNVHSNRSPADGKVLDIQYVAGSFVNADFDKASTENERNAIIMQLPSGEKISVVQIAGLIARRILCYTNVGAELSRGQRYGFIRFGSRVDIYLPTTAKILVSIGQNVSATETILARLDH